MVNPTYTCKQIFDSFMYTHWHVQYHKKIMLQSFIFKGRVKCDIFWKMATLQNVHNMNFRGPQIISMQQMKSWNSWKQRFTP